MHSRLRWLLFAAVLAIAAPARAQGPVVISAQDAGACATANACADFGVGQVASVAFDISGTWTGTLTFEGSVDGTIWRTIMVNLPDTGATATTTTANGTFSVTNFGLTKVRVRAGTFASGSASVSLRAGFGSARSFSPTFGTVTTTADINGGNSINAAQQLTAGTNIFAGSAGVIGFSNRARWTSPSDGKIDFTNAASTTTISIDTGAAGNGQSFNLVNTLTELTTIAAAAFTDTTIQIPARASVLGVSVRVTTEIPTAATFTVGDAGLASRYSTTTVETAAGSTNSGNAWIGYVSSGPLAIRITPNLTPANNSGRVRVTLYYYTITPPTS